MARIVYALSGQGRGHTSRVIAMSDALRKRGHKVTFCCGGTAREILESRGEHVIPVPALRQVMVDNQIRLLRTFGCNLGTVLNLRRIVGRLAERLEAESPDLLITDFEAFSPRAAARLGLPVLSFNHQQVVTELEYELPPQYRAEAALAATAIRLIAPKNPTHTLLTSFFFGPLRHPDTTTLIPPIIRTEVQRLEPSDGDEVLVYYNQSDGTDGVIDALANVDARFTLYNFDTPPNPDRYPNITFKEPSIEGFANDLAACKAVICTAGFTLISEALYLRKPLLVVPNRGIFEQTINAIFLQQKGFGAAVIERQLTDVDVKQFMSNIHLYRARMANQDVLGNGQAVEFIERLLMLPVHRNGAQSASGEGTYAGLATGPYVAKAE